MRDQRFKLEQEGDTDVEEEIVSISPEEPVIDKRRKRPLKKICENDEKGSPAVDSSMSSSSNNVPSSSRSLRPRPKRPRQ